MNTSSTTVLRLGKLEAPVALYKTVGDPPNLSEWETAGPTGGVLKAPASPSAGSDPLSASGSSGVTTSRKVATAPLVEEGTGFKVPREEVRKGLRDGPVFIDLTDQIARIEAATHLEEMRVTAFIRRERVPRERIIGSYWVGPNGPGAAPRTLKLLHAAMKVAGRYAVVRWTKRTRQAHGVMAPHRSGALIILELAWADCIRMPDERILGPQTVEVTDDEVTRAAALIGAMSDSPVALDELEDDAVVLRRSLAEMARSGEDVSGFLVEVTDGDAVPRELMAQLEATISEA